MIEIFIWIFLAPFIAMLAVMFGAFVMIGGGLILALFAIPVGLMTNSFYMEKNGKEYKWNLRKFRFELKENSKQPIGFRLNLEGEEK